jgi:proline racemase
VLPETGIVPLVEPVTELILESPAGLIAVTCECRHGKVERVRFVNQPALVHHLGVSVMVPGVGKLEVDVAYGGMTYVIVDAESLGYQLIPSEAGTLRELGEKIKRPAAQQFPVVHPDDPRIPGITNTLFAGPIRRDGDAWRARNTVVVSPGRVDRSPCGTGTFARLAQLHARGILGVGEAFVHESITGTTFESSIVEAAQVGNLPAVIPAEPGQAWITGISQLGVDPTDPSQRGFTVADTWLRSIDDLPPIRTAADL